MLVFLTTARAGAAEAPAAESIGGCETRILSYEQRAALLDSVVKFARRLWQFPRTLLEYSRRRPFEFQVTRTLYLRLADRAGAG
jgi:hypothetical protein